MIGPGSPAALAGRFAAIAEHFSEDGPAERLERSRRGLLAAVQATEPATLNQVAAVVRRGAPAVSRSIDALVRAGLVERAADPDNRRRLAMRLTDAGHSALAAPATYDRRLAARLERLAPSELRAVERAIEILER